MTKTFTQNDVLRYFYNEVSKLEKEHIEDFLSCNEAMSTFYCELLNAEDVIEAKLEKPPTSVVNNILNYSKSLCMQN